MLRYAKTSLLTLLAAAMLSVSSMKAQNMLAETITNENSKSKKNIEQIIVPDFFRSYDMVLPIKNADSTTVWRSYEFNDSLHTRRSPLPRRVRVIDGRTKINLLGLYSKDLEFKTYLDEDGRPVESIIVTRDGKSRLKSYDSTIARREFTDWQDIKTLGHTTFNYAKGISRTPTNTWIKNKEDTLIYINSHVLDMQAAYFMLVEKIFNRPSPFDTTVNIIYKGKELPVWTRSEDCKIDTDDANYDCKKLNIDLTEKINGKKEPFVDGIRQLTIYIDKKTHLPLRIDTEEPVLNLLLIKIQPYARLHGTNISK